MKASERDELLIELRTSQKLLFKQNTDDHKDFKAQQKEINVHLDDHSYRIKQAEDDIKTAEKLSEERNKPSKKTLAGIGSAVIAIGFAIWRSFSNGV